MKKLVLALSVSILALYSCQNTENSVQSDSPATAQAQSRDALGQEGVVDDQSSPDIVKLAVANDDLTTLVTAVKAAGLTTSLSNAGPFTVFAPLNSAFDKLPAGTVDNLLKKENLGQLEDILGHHTYVGVIRENQFSDGQNLGMVDGKNITIKMVDGKPTVNGTINIVATVPASNGIIHVVDGVILPE
ncbi:MAG: fasciclin domain-containing protein [Flavobacteriia bacterium]|nr:fasciclin domain-containing protein [Flavobacteriia bacterium]